jgi:PGAP1-like protein
MTRAEFRALGKLGGKAAAAVTWRAENVHRAVAHRVFGQIGGVGAPARFAHDTVAGGAYLGVRSACAAAGAVTGEIMSMLTVGGAPLSRTPQGNNALAALNALAGDQLRQDLEPLAIPMTVRQAGRDVRLTGEELAAAFPAATSKLAVFVHGLGETENAWLRTSGAPSGAPSGRHGGRHGGRYRGATAGAPQAPYGDGLRARFGYTPVYVRYNTGLHISANGRDLAVLLTRLTSAWPAPVSEMLLVGHSMGGLVIRAACHYGEHDGAEWPALVRDVFYLGSPHLGAPLARAAGRAGWLLAKAAETRPFVTLVNGSSAGIKDLRHGYVVDSDWAECDMDRCASDHRGDTPLLAGASHHVISATVTSDPASRVGAVVGDLLVQPASAHGRRRRQQWIPFPARLGHWLADMHHFDLLNHPAVWDAMRGALAGRDAGAAGATP